MKHAGRVGSRPYKYWLENTIGSDKKAVRPKYILKVYRACGNEGVEPMSQSMIGIGQESVLNT